MAREHNDRKNDRRDEPKDDIMERLVSINRVAKVVKGGKRFGFAALVVVGDGKGRIGHASAKAREVPDAIAKATSQARRSMFRVPLREGRTLHHDVLGRFGSGKVQLRTAPPGTGVIAGGPIRAVFEALGIQDVVAKSLGSNNPHNMVKAALAGLVSTQSPRAVAGRRSKRVSDVLGNKKDDGDANAADEAAE
jgi:small subunit ribosomal protein S5